MVLADGRLVKASATEHPDLFWAIRGRGGNFGVATSFEFRLHPVGTVTAGPIFWPVEKAGDALAPAGLLNYLKADFVDEISMDEGDERVRATYGGNYDRLAAIKRVYDPTNLFRLNQNVCPAS